MNKTKESSISKEEVASVNFAAKYNAKQKKLVAETEVRCQEAEERWDKWATAMTKNWATAPLDDIPYPEGYDFNEDIKLKKKEVRVVDTGTYACYWGMYRDDSSESGIFQDVENAIMFLQNVLIPNHYDDMALELGVEWGVESLSDEQIQEIDDASLYEVKEVLIRQERFVAPDYNDEEGWEESLNNYHQNENN
jgi:hypothetical protein